MIFNLLIFAVTFFLVARLFWKDGKWAPENARGAFRFFTVQSNALCGAAALLRCVLPDAPWTWTFKYIGTAAVTVTLLTVLFFLAPSMGGLAPLLKGGELFMHLLTPLAAIVSFSFFEKRGMGLGTALLGTLPVVLYGLWYLYKVIYAPADRRWNDFYGFNKSGKWHGSFVGMMLCGLAVCLGLMALQNL